MALKRTPIKRGKPLRKVSAKKQAYRAAPEGQAALAYMQAVKGLPCAACGASPPSDAHHVQHDRYSARKAPDWDTIPLCKSCHQDGPGAFHRDKAAWRERHGADHSYIPATAALVEKIFGLVRKSD